MACAVPEEVSERLTCAICMEQFKQPKVLPCLHTYCKECLVKLVKKQGSDHVITCPECRLDTKVPDRDVGKLQPNFWVNNFMTLLSMQNSTSSGKPLICEHCDSGDLAVSRCSDCSVFMCQFCVTAHKRITTTKGHQILSLTEVKTLGSKALTKPVFCVKHTGETLKLFCETCQETICRDCTIVDHREHKYNFVSDVAARERKAVQASLKKTKAKGRAVVEGLKAVQMMKNCVQSKVSDVNREVDAFFDEQVKALEYYRANLKHEVTTQGQIRVNQLENQTEVLSSFLAQLKSGINFTDQAITDGDDVKLLSMKKQLIQRLAQLNSSQIQCKPCTDDYLKPQVHQTIWDIGKMVTMRYLPIDPQKCTVSMVGGEEGVMYQTLVGQEVELLLIIKDEKGQKITEGGHQVRAQVIFNSEENQGQKKDLSPIRCNGDGSYSILYCPEDDGLVTLSVMVEGQEVCGSPFNWKVNPQLLNIIPGSQKMKQGKKLSARAVSRGYQVGESASFFKDGKHCWKLQLSSFNTEAGRCQLEIGVTSSPSYPVRRQQRANTSKWSWHYNADDQQSLRSDSERSSIISVQDSDVFAVFLNLETKKLIIYNARSKQTEIFTGVEEDGLVPIISCSCRPRAPGALPVLNVL